MKWTLFISFLFGVFSLFGQNQSETILLDSLSSSVEKPIKVKVKNPKKALFLSLALPGAGDVYNKRWWKLPLVYGGIGGVIYGIDWNTKQFNRFKTALNLKRQGEVHEFTDTRLDDETALRNLRDSFDKNKQLSYIGLVAVHGLQAIWAFVDAHLKDFDIDEDISSIRIKPSLDIYDPTGEPIYGVGISIPLSGR